jgi:Protein of unknown function (DUF3016)
VKRGLAAALLCVGLAASCGAPGEKLADGSTSDVEALEEHVRKRAARLLAPGERLTLEITDLDRAGSPENSRPGLSGVRVVRDVYPVRIEFTFRLGIADGGMSEEGAVSLSGLPVAAAAAYGEDPLRYERALLDAWLERKLRRP